MVEGNEDDLDQNNKGYPGLSAHSKGSATIPCTWQTQSQGEVWKGFVVGKRKTSVIF